MHHGVEPFGHDGWFGLHIAAYPFQHHAHKAILIKINDELLVLFLHRDVFTLYKHPQQRVQHFIEVLLHLFPADGAVDIQHQHPVGLHLFQHIAEGVAPRLKVLMAFQCLCGILHQDPVHQVVNILEMVVKGHAVHAAVLGNVVYRYLIQRLAEQQLFERCFQRAFCRLCHENAHPFAFAPFGAEFPNFYLL